MEATNTAAAGLRTTIEPWLTVADGAAAARFYQAAFGATETYRMEAPDGGLVIKFSVDGAGFWISADAHNTDPIPAGNGPIRMILTVTDPDERFTQAINAGASIIFPVGEGHGWRLGRLADPFGHHWEVGRPLSQ